MKAVILARVSTLKQEKEGLSLKDIQLPELREYAKSKEFEIVQEFVFSESADRKIRTKFTEMVEFVKQNTDIKAIITYRVDRITRNFRDAVLIDDLRIEHDKEIHFVHDRLIISKNSVGRDIQDWDLKVFLAKQYLNRLKEDAINSKLYKLRNGELPSGAPFGYKNVTLEDGKKWVDIEEFKGNIVKRMFEWYATETYSMNELRYKVKEDFSLNFSKGFVDSILKNRFYYGIMVDKRDSNKEYSHRYEKLITYELFQRVQEIKEGFNKKHFKFAGLPYFYRGLFRCSDCDCMITPEKKKGKYVYYHCTEYNGKHGACWVREEEITKQLASVYKEIQIPTEVLNSILDTLKGSHNDKKNYYKGLYQNFEREYNKLQQRLEKMYEDKLDGRITEDFYSIKYQEYRDKQAEIKQKMVGLERADDDYYLTASYLLQLTNKAYDLFISSEMEEKRQLLKLTLQNLRLDKGLVRYDLIKPFDKILFYASRQEWLPR